jgi:Bacterial SH3 domain
MPAADSGELAMSLRKAARILRSLSFSCALAVATCLVGLTEASAQDRCRVMDPTGTPLNVRTAPDGNVVGTLSNGTLVKILDRPSNVRERTWVYVGRYEDRVPIGWVYRNYLDCTRTARMEQFRRLPGQAFKWTSWTDLPRLMPLRVNGSLRHGCCWTRSSNDGPP